MPFLDSCSVCFTPRSFKVSLSHRRSSPAVGNGAVGRTRRIHSAPYFDTTSSDGTRLHFQSHPKHLVYIVEQLHFNSSPESRDFSVLGLAVVYPQNVSFKSPPSVRIACSQLNLSTFICDDPSAFTPLTFCLSFFVCVCILSLMKDNFLVAGLADPAMQSFLNLFVYLNNKCLINQLTETCLGF